MVSGLLHNEHIGRQLTSVMLFVVVCSRLCVTVDPCYATGKSGSDCRWCYQYSIENDLRSHLDDIPKDKHLVVSCASGQRSFYACRILQQHGIRKCGELGRGFCYFPLRAPIEGHRRGNVIPNIVYTCRPFVLLI